MGDGVELAQRRCVRGAKKLEGEELAALQAELPAWRVEEGALRRTFRFADFRHAVFFVNAIAAIAEREDHHPDVTIRYRDVDLTLTTHDARGLTENDFVLAAKIDDAAA
jgi:4a-hydroxytetrahydrobiopterin dehydratase